MMTFFAFVEKVVEIVLHTIEVSGGPIGGDAAVWQLRSSTEADEEREQRSVNVLHVAGLSYSFQVLNKEGKYSVAWDLLPHCNILLAQPFSEPL